MYFGFKILVSSIIIAISTEVAKRNPSFGGLILALPLTSIIAFAFMGYQGTESTSLYSYAKSTMIFVPISLVFFIPFLIPITANWNFISKFLLGIGMLTVINYFLIKMKFLEF